MRRGRAVVGLRDPVNPPAPTKLVPIGERVLKDRAERDYWRARAKLEAEEVPGPRIPPPEETAGCRTDLDPDTVAFLYALILLAVCGAIALVIGLIWAIASAV